MNVSATGYRWVTSKIDASPLTLGQGFVPMSAPAKMQPQFVAPTGDGAGSQSKVDLQKALNNLKQVDNSARVQVDPKTNAATFIGGNVNVVLKPGIGGDGPDRVARTFFSSHGGLFGVTHQYEQLKLTGVSTDEQGINHYRYQQMHQGLPVFGQQIAVHAKGNAITSVGGDLVPNIPHAEAKITSDHAFALATRSAVSSLRADEETVDLSKLKPMGKEELGWFRTESGVPRLAYSLVIGNGGDQKVQVFIDAQNGTQLDSWSMVHSAKLRETVHAKTNETLNETSAPSVDEHMNKAHKNAGDVYDYYKEEYDRDSIDGKGMKMKSIVSYGTKYNNAFWNGSHMTYGDGDGVFFSPLGDGVDVVGHEMTHGVTERTAGLQYRNQSGALNESFSDVFGNLIEKWVEVKDGRAERDPKWLIGEEIFTPAVEGDALRSMSAPGTAYNGIPGNPNAKDKQPAHMKDYNNTPGDNGGVHTNSGIPNKAAYEIVMKIGADKLGEVWYRALTKYMTPTTKFDAAANFTVQAAIDLYGKGSDEAQAVVDGWTSVGITPSIAGSWF